MEINLTFKVLLCSILMKQMLKQIKITGMQRMTLTIPTDSQRKGKKLCLLPRKWSCWNLTKGKIAGSTTPNLCKNFHNLRVHLSGPNMHMLLVQRHFLLLAARFSIHSPKANIVSIYLLSCIAHYINHSVCHDPNFKIAGIDGWTSLLTLPIPKNWD